MDGFLLNSDDGESASEFSTVKMQWKNNRTDAAGCTGIFILNVLILSG